MSRTTSTYLFQRISKEGRTEGLKIGSREARDWFRDRALSVSRATPNTIIEKAPKLYSRITVNDIGRMYMFMYDPKHKKTLPYYDRFPMIFMMEKTEGGFLGMNLHYLPPTYRARLMDALYTVRTNDSARDSEKLRISYGILNKSAKYRYFRPCIKQYLNKQVRSQYVYVPYEEWDIALMLPTERFMKKPKSTVWNESKRIIRRRR